MLYAVFVMMAVILLGTYHMQALNRLDAHYAGVAGDQESIVAAYQKKNAALIEVVGILSNSRPMVFTSYNALANQTDDTPNITASNKEIFGGVLALSRELLMPYNHPDSYIEYGDTVLVMLEMVVEDTMAKRWRSRGDVYLLEYSDSIQFGKKKGFLYHESG